MRTVLRAAPRGEGTHTTVSWIAPRGGERPGIVRKIRRTRKKVLENLVHPIIIRFPDDPKHVWGCEQDGTVGYVIKNHNPEKSKKYIFL